MQQKLKIAIIGDGNAGNYLANEFLRIGVDTFRFSRKGVKPFLHLKEYGPMADDFDLILLCVSDSAISGVSNLLPPGKAITAHISGATSIDVLDKKHTERAVFYPLMSLNNATDIKINEIPFGLEANHPDTLHKLMEISDLLTLKAYPLNSAQRSKLHLAAVISQNFSNYLYQLSYEILSENNMNMDILKPLLLQSVQKLGNAEPITYQTGPAVRNDKISMKANLDLLKNEEDKKLYRLMSEWIKKKYDEKL